MTSGSDPFAELSEILRKARPVRWVRVESDEMSFEKTDGWGTATGYLELTDDGTVRRVVWVYANGKTLRYGPGEIEDEFGALPDQPLTDEELPESAREIPDAEFGRVWASALP